MPREPIPLVREGGFLEAEKMFVLSYEGKISEKKYFEDFRKDPILRYFYPELKWPLKEQNILTLKTKITQNN